ncbi:hypothetical protein BDR03DRAFT_951994, partial [Suillus americanus]
KRLVHAGCAVYTNLDGRSSSAHQRALDAGMINIKIPLKTFLSKSNWIISIVPPGEAFAFTRRVVAASQFRSPSLPFPRAFVDCNAVNSETVKRIRGLFRVGFIDGRDRWDLTFYACTESGSEDVLEEFTALSQYGLKISLLKGAGAGIGDASLRWWWQMMKKGSIGLFMTMILIPEGIPKAYRFVAEMEGLAEFVGGGEADVFKGFARVFERVAGSLEGDGVDIETLKSGVEKALEVQGTSK